MNIVSLFGALMGLVLICVLAALFIWLVALLITAWVKKSRKLALWSFAGTAGAMLTVTGLLFGLFHLFGPYDPTSEAELKITYKADFGTLPPVGITVLKARQVVIGDSGAQWLLLKAAPEEIERHIALGFKRADLIPPDFCGNAGANAPRWWQPPRNRLEIYQNKDWSKNGGWFRSEATIGVDRAANLIWFVASKSS